MSRVLGNLKNTAIFTAMTILFSSASAFAADINLSGIEISQAEQGYNVTLKTDKKTSYKKMIKGSEQLVIEMKNTAATEDFATAYNDVATINNVTVTPSGSDDLKIQIQGTDVDKSNISLDYKNSALPVESQNFDPNQINLSLPVDNYKPVYDKNSGEETEEASMGGFWAKLNPASVAEKLNSNSDTSLIAEENTDESAPSNSGFKWLSYLGLFVIIGTAAVNIFKKSNSEAAIGLTQSFKEREREIAKKLNAEVKETLSLRSKIAQNSSPQNAPSINYGLRSYQNAQKNPYEMNSNPIKVQRPSTLSNSLPERGYGSSSLKTTSQTRIPKYTQPTQSTRTPSTFSTPVNRVQRDTRAASTVSAPIRNTMPQQTGNVDSMKFLESMTKIYEKNGRTDLAAGLKNKINKVNI